MASTQAIAAVSRTLLGLIEQNCPRNLLISPKFELCTTAQLDKPIAEGVSLCLYRVALNGLGRNLPPRRADDGSLCRPSLPVDLHFLITPWASNAEHELRILGRAMECLESNPVISGPDDPFLKMLVGATFAVFLVIMALQWLRLRRVGSAATLHVQGGLR